MGVCKNCIYIGDAYECRMRHPKDDFRCKNLKNAEVDFITGEIIQASCRMKNEFGECPHFDDGSIALYAWVNGENIVYTLSKSPLTADDYVSDANEKIGEIASVNVFYAWRYNNRLCYTVTYEPESDDSVYELSGEIKGVITLSEDKKITVSEKTYSRSRKDDVYNAFIVINDKKYIRDENQDTKIERSE